jgi:signal transduction histidine kinase
MSEDPLRGAALAEQQASFRRVAMLVAAGAASAEVFEAIAREVAQVLRPRLVQIFRWERDGSVTVVGSYGEEPNPFPAGSNWPWEDPSLVAVKEHLMTGAPILVENVAETLAGALAEAGLSVGVGSAAGAPIIVGDETWGHMSIEMAKGVALPPGVADRLAEITELLATAIASSAAREQLTRLADEQAALRRVATLVAGGAPPAAVFDAVAGELGRLLGVGSSGLVRFEGDGTAQVVAGWGRLDEVAPVGARLPIGGKNAITEIARTGNVARIEDFDRVASGAIGDVARRLNTHASIGVPVVVGGRLWGAMVAAPLEGEPLPPDSEPRLAQFIELVVMAIANTETRVELARLAEEQAALRRVATLVAEEVPAAEVFAKVAEEAATAFGDQIDSAILRLEGDDTATVVAVWGNQPAGGIRVNTRLPIEGSGITARVFRERRAVRVDDYASADGAIADHARVHGIRAAVGCPILVQGRLWGSLVVAHYEPEPLPSDAERRLSQFAELVATAIANAEARAEVRRLADEQASLRRLATLIAEGARPADVFDAVIEEVARQLGAAQVGLMRFEGPDEVVILARRGQDSAVVDTGHRLRLDGESATARVLRTGKSTRLDHYEGQSGTIAEIAQRSRVNATVGAPVVVEGALWGAFTASWEGDEVPPADAEERLAAFAELVDTAIANADSRDRLTASRTRVLTAADEARRRVVRDLHDGAQQRLVHTIVSLKLAQRARDEGDVQTGPLIEEALDQAEQANVELRELAHGILPTVLTRGGLSAAVDALVSRIDIPVDVRISHERLPAEIEANAYFIVAEALTNVVKHSHARRADVTATVEAGTLKLEVSDDGVGGVDPDGHGLIGVGDRAAALGGRLRIDSPPNGGTLLAAELPLPG